MMPWIGYWSGEAMHPVGTFLDKCRAQYKVGGSYSLAEPSEHSKESRSQYFARLAEIHATLHERYSKTFPTIAAMRAWALCRTGFCTQKRIACGAPEVARRWVAEIRNSKIYAEVGIGGEGGDVVVMFVPESQSKESMGADKFKESKKAVLKLLESLLETGDGELDAHMKSSPAAHNA
jgi:hypothetical protein